MPAPNENQRGGSVAPKLNDCPVRRTMAGEVGMTRLPRPVKTDLDQLPFN